MNILKIALYGLLAIILYKLLNTKVIISSAKVSPGTSPTIPFPAQSIVDYAKPVQDLKETIVPQLTNENQYVSPVSTIINPLVTPISTI